MKTWAICISHVLSAELKYSIKTTKGLTCSQKLYCMEPESPDRSQLERTKTKLMWQIFTICSKLDEQNKFVSITR